MRTFLSLRLRPQRSEALPDGSANHPRAARMVPAKWPSRSVEMSERLAPEGRSFGIRQRLSLPDCPLILRSKDGFCFACSALMHPSPVLSADIQSQGACVMQPSSAEHSERSPGNPASTPIPVRSRTSSRFRPNDPDCGRAPSSPRLRRDPVGVRHRNPPTCIFPQERPLRVHSWAA
jgi:hypothetical protein